MYKRVAKGDPDWHGAGVQDIYSVSGCISEDFADYIDFWKHNGYWLFDSPAIMKNLAAEHDIDLSGTTLFYYEVYEEEFDEKSRQWSLFSPEEAFETNVVSPQVKELMGFDVVTFSGHTLPECSPLSCNALAKEISVNRHCLLDTFEDAKRLIECGAFDMGEPAPYRIFAVHRT